MTWNELNVPVARVLKYCCQGLDIRTNHDQMFSLKALIKVTLDKHVCLMAKFKYYFLSSIIILLIK